MGAVFIIFPLSFMQGSCMLHLHALEVGREQEMDWVAKDLEVTDSCSGVGIRMDIKHEES